jgi:hypothetical protein
MGRFLSEDPAGLAANLNLYLFALNNPVGQRDPFGRDAWGLDDIDWLQLGTDFFSGMGSGITWGITDWIQDCMGTGGVVNRDSPVYFVGELIGDEINDHLTGGLGRLDDVVDISRMRNRLGDTVENAGATRGASELALGVHEHLPDFVAKLRLEGKQVDIVRNMDQFEDLVQRAKQIHFNMKGVDPALLDDMSKYTNQELRYLLDHREFWEKIHLHW